MDAIAYQVRDVLDAMESDAGERLASLRVDGGAAANDALLQFQADLLGVAVERPTVTETTAAGAAFLAGIATGFWSGPDEVAATWALDRRFVPDHGRPRARAPAVRLAPRRGALARLGQLVGDGPSLDLRAGSRASDGRPRRR